MKWLINILIVAGLFSLHQCSAADHRRKGDGMISNQNILDGLNHVEPYQSYTSSEDDSSELQSQLVGFNQQHLQLRRGMAPTRTIVDDHHLKLIRRKKEIPNPDVTQKKSNVTISSTSKTVDTKAIKQQSLLAVELPKDKAPQNPNVKLLKQSAPNPANSPVPKVQTPITYLSQKESVKINPTYINNNKQTINNNEVNNIKLTKVNNEFTIPPKQKSTGSTTYLSQKENVQINPTYIANSKQTINNKEVNNIKVTNVNNNVIYKPQFTNFGSLSDARNLPSFKNGFIPVNGRFLPASAFNTGRFTTYTTSRSTEFNVLFGTIQNSYRFYGAFRSRFELLDRFNGRNGFIRGFGYVQGFAASFGLGSFLQRCSTQQALLPVIIRSRTLIPTFNGFIDRFISGGDVNFETSQPLDQFEPADLGGNIQLDGATVEAGSLPLASVDVELPQVATGTIALTEGDINTSISQDPGPGVVAEVSQDPRIVAELSRDPGVLSQLPQNSGNTIITQVTQEVIPNSQPQPVV